MNNPSFKDNFSRQSALYAKYRPQYPKALYEYLAGLTEQHELAWDCGTGNGQAATDLAAFYHTIIATDPSEQQIKHAVPHERVTYRVEQAEQSSLITGTADLMVVANALHWMDFERFYREADRVMKPGAVFAAWTFRLPVITPEIDEVLHYFHYTTIGDYWLPENELIDQEYATIPFPFHPVESPDFFLERTMNLDDFIGYINTWSACQRFIAEKEYNPADSLRTSLQDIWGAMPRQLRWKLILKAGRKL